MNLCKKIKLIILILILFLLASCAGFDLRPDPRPWTDSEKAFLWWSIIATGADAYTSIRQNHSHKYDDIYETNPRMHRHPEDEEIIVYLGVGQLITGIMAHWWSEITLPIIGRINVRKVLLGCDAAQHSVLAVTNTRNY